MPDDIISPAISGYRRYYDELVPRLRPGGLMVLGNVVRGGRVLDRTARGPADIAIRELNDAVVADDRVKSIMLPVRDGVTLIRRR